MTLNLKGSSHDWLICFLSFCLHSMLQSPTSTTLPTSSNFPASHKVNSDHHHNDMQAYWREVRSIEEEKEGEEEEDEEERHSMDGEYH